MKRNDIYAIVMAGGKGERFWPQSRASHPKQLLRLIGNLTLIEQTVERLMPLVEAENVIVITNQDYVAPMQSLLSSIPPENIVGEPMGRDTAPCVALAAALVKAKAGNDDAIMLLLPANIGKNTKIECHGTVVRVVPIAAADKTIYETAIFFDDVTEKAKSAISRHIKKIMAHAS